MGTGVKSQNLSENEESGMRYKKCMRVVMVSDAHLEGIGDPNQDALVRWLDALEVDRVYLLGDIFHHWWGFHGAVMNEYVPVCAALLRLKARGIGLHLVVGNHDFAAGPFFREVLGATVSGPVSVTLDGTRFLLAHGDESDTRWSYRLTRTLLRGPIFAGMMRMLGPSHGGRLLRYLAGASREHMGDLGPLIEQQRKWAVEQLQRAPLDCVVMGHIHHPEVYDVDGGSVVHSGAWIGHRTFVLVEDGVVSLRRWHEDVPPLGMCVSAP